MSRICQAQLQQWHRCQRQAGNANFRFREERFQDNITRPQACQNPSSAASHPGGRQNCNQNRRGREHCHRSHTNTPCGQGQVNTTGNARAQLASFENVILQHPTACQAEMDTEHSFTLIWDSGASACITGVKSDFKDGIKPHNGQCQGIGSDLKI